MNKRWLRQITILLLMVIASSVGVVSAADKTTIEVAVFQGGFGLDFFQQVGKDYEKLRPEITVNVWGNPRPKEQLRPRIVQGNPPEAMWIEGEPDPMSNWTLIREKKLYSLNAALETKAYGQEKQWKDTFTAGVLNAGSLQGEQYLIPFNMNIFAIVYNAGMFEEHGWQVPETWEELDALAAKIKAEGIAPFTYQGKYANYANAGFFMPLAISIGGTDWYVDAANLKPGAWSSQTVLGAAKRIREFVDKGYFLPGSNALDHTESQLQFIMGKAAMIPCGSWFQNEMQKFLSPDFQLRFMPLPPVAGGPSSLEVRPVHFAVATDSKNPELGADFVKFITSLDKTSEFVKTKGTLTSIEGSEKSMRREAVRDLAGQLNDVDFVQMSEKTFFAWYPTLFKAVNDGMAGLLTKELSPEEFAQKIEDTAKRIRESGDIPIMEFVL